MIPTRQTATVLTVALLAGLVSVLSAQQAAGPALLDRVTARLAASESTLIAIRRDLHQHPEISLAEERTARVVAERLQSLGLEVRTGVGGYGVVGILRGGRPGPLVAFRADMDAIPTEAPDPVEFRSVTPGVRHICGHDVHTTVGLALAEGLSAVRAELPGSVMFLFQPAEERVVGAQAMLEGGVFEPVKPAAIFGLHTAPLPVGQLGTMPGTMMAWRDGVQVTITGPGDLAVAADSVRRVLESVGTVAPAQALSAMPPGFIFVQVAPPVRASGAWTVQASVSVATAASSDLARDGITRGLGRHFFPGVTITPAYRARAVPGVTNDAELTAAATRSIRAALGAESVLDLDVISPAFSEDYGAFEERVPGVFYYLGVGPIGMPHSPGYVADERAILVGARAMAAAVLDRLSGG